MRVFVATIGMGKMMGMDSGKNEHRMVLWISGGRSGCCFGVEGGDEMERMDSVLRLFDSA